MEDKNLEIMRHSLSHVMAYAVKNLYPDVKFAIGPAIENGFYYDFDFGEQKVGEEDLSAIEKEMNNILKKNFVFEKRDVAIDEAIKLAKEEKEDYKKELLLEFKEEKEKTVSFYKLGEFEDLCKGPHLEKAGKNLIGNFKLSKLAGAYWRGDEKNKMLTRIYAYAFSSKEELNKYLEIMKEAEKRDHRKLGKELDFFSISEKVGPGLILWHPKLSKTREVLESFWREFHRKRGYDAVYTPHIGRSELWETSGHLSFFKDSMYSSMDVDGEKYYVKPMNCPFHVEIYKSRPRSWREFPFRWNEMGTVYRYEKSGELHGMSRVRGFTQDDAHVICRRDQFEEEYRGVLKFTFDMFKVFGFKELKGYLAIRDPENVEQYMGSNEIWDTAEKTIKEIVKEFDMPYEIEEGGAKFYGPALDIKAKDSIGREWQLTTIQLDFNLPEKFKMFYQGKEKEETPIMIHRALLGSLERFFSILIEHYEASFPVWLAPLQVKILSVGEKHQEYCQKLKQEFLQYDIRVEVDDGDETVGNKIRKAAKEKIPYILVVGDNEIKSGELSVRDRGTQETRSLSKEDFIKEIEEKNKNKK
jgi:threonyl-tRNA synthetase